MIEWMCLGQLLSRGESNSKDISKAEQRTLVASCSSPPDTVILFVIAAEFSLVSPGQVATVEQMQLENFSD